MYFIEHYQGGRYLGSVNHNGILDQSKIGYVNRVIVKEGVFQLKKKHVATPESPIILISYNMQGRIE